MLTRITRDPRGPSVIQLRTQDVLPANDRLKRVLLDVLRRYQSQLEHGALISVDESRSRVRLLPILQARGGSGSG